MLKKLTLLLAVGIAAGMLKWGGEFPETELDLSGADSPEQREIEVTSLPEDDEKPTMLIDLIRIAAAPIEEPVPLVAEIATDPEAEDSAPVELAAPDTPAPLPEADGPKIALIEADVPVETAGDPPPEPARAVSHSIVPRPRPLRLSARAPEAPLAEAAVAEALAAKPVPAPKPAPDLAKVEPTALALAVEKALAPLEEEETPVTLAAIDTAADTSPVTSPDRPDQMLYVTGTKVNLRGGPTTHAGVVTRLDRGDATELLATTANGWLRIRDISTGDVGYMSAEFLSAEYPG